jgi:predicted amidohydrolase
MNIKTKIKQMSLSRRKNITTVELVSFQLLRKYHEPKDMWAYIKDEIIKFYSSKQHVEDVTSVLVLPEYALGNKIRFPKSKIDYNENLDECKELTSNFEINLFAGSAAVNVDDKWKNRCYFISSEGKIQFYDKQKLFNYEKKLTFSPGGGSSIFTLPGGERCQILICSDLWYPELIREFLSNLPDIVVVPAMSVVPKENLIGYGEWLWHSLATTRSRENVVPVVVSDWAVQPFGESWTCGASCILNPSIKWTSTAEFDEAFITLHKKQNGPISTSVSLQEIYDYREYRKKTGLLPE